MKFVTRQHFEMKTLAGVLTGAQDREMLMCVLSETAKRFVRLFQCTVGALGKGSFSVTLSKPFLFPKLHSSFPVKLPLPLKCLSVK